MAKTILVIALLALLPAAGRADTVTVSERVLDGLNVRAEPASGSTRVGKLRRGQTARPLDRVPRWYKIRLGNGTEGFISKAWAVVIADDGVPAATLAAKATDDLRLHFFNVGAGTCTLIECPGADARPIVVDCGAAPDGRGAHAISDDALAARFAGILGGRAPDVVLSHGDAEHYNLIPFVLGEAPVHEIWQGGAKGSYARSLRTWLERQRKGGAKLRSGFPENWHNGAKPIEDGLQCGDASAYVMTVNTGPTLNADSLVLMIEYKDFTAILPAGAEAQTEQNAIRNFAGGLKATLLAGSDHGAKTWGSNSAKWSKATAPEVVVYSAGTKYGHPSCFATNTLDNALVSVPRHNAICGLSNSETRPYWTRDAEYMTRVNGTVTVTTDGTTARSSMRDRTRLRDEDPVLADAHAADGRFGHDANRVSVTPN